MLEEARQGVAVTLQVLKMNPARRLYERLGFCIVGETGMKYRMKAEEERCMRIALFSDVHGNVTALEAVMKEIREKGPLDAVVCAGDIVFYGPSPEEVVDLLRAEGVSMVRGNCDDMVTGQLSIETVASDPVRLDWLRAHVKWTRERLGEERLEFLRSLPVTRTFDPAPGQSLLVCHASPLSTNEPLPRPDILRKEGQQYYGETEARVIAVGHWHQPSVTLLGERMMLNVSSVSIPMDGRPIACYTIAEWRDGIWSFEQYRVDYDLAPVIHRIRDRKMPLPPWPKLEE
jgi:predicted phosphodiesterase